MKFEYLIFNLIVFSGPIIFSFDKRVHFFSKWKFAFLANAIVLVPFIMWDSLVAGKHWWFNTNYTLDLSILGLPVEEWLFFISVPLACIFIWEVLKFYIKSKKILLKLKIFYYLLILGFPIGIFFLINGKEYSGLVSIFIAFTALLDKALRTKIFLLPQTYLLLIIVSALILIFNGFLTARPVVLYDWDYQLNIKIFTIPIEDFFYGFSLVLMNLSVYEKLKEKFNG